MRIRKGRFCKGGRQNSAPTMKLTSAERVFDCRQRKKNSQNVWEGRPRNEHGTISRPRNEDGTFSELTCKQVWIGIEKVQIILFSQINQMIGRKYDTTTYWPFQIHDALHRKCTGGRMAEKL